MSNINPIFSIEYPNLDTLLFIRKQYPQLADMEIGTNIIDEECIIAHYLPAEDKACQVAEELIYFGSLLSSTTHFHRTDDQYDLVYRCVSLAHEAEERKTVEAFSSLDEEEKIKVKMEVPSFERVNQVSVEHTRRNDVLTITYPRDKTVFTSINVNDPEEYFENIKTISDGVRTIFKREYDFEANPRLLGIKDMIKIYIDDLSKVAERVRKVSGPFDPGIEKAIIEEVITNIVPKISALVLKPQFIANRPD